MSDVADPSHELSSVPQRGGLLAGILGVQPAVSLVCLLVWSLTNMDQGLFGLIVPGVLGEFHLPLSVIGSILTISFLVGAVLVVVAGIAADRFDRITILVALLAASAIMVGLQGLAGGIVGLTALRALGFGVSSGLAPITNAMVAENTRARYRGLSMGLLQCGYPLGWLIGSLAASPLLALYGWRAACFVAFAVVPLCVPILLVLRRATSASRSRPIVALPIAAAAPELRDLHQGGPRQGGLRQVGMLLLPRYRRASLASAAIFFLFGGAYAGSAFFFPAFFSQQRGYGATQAARLVGLSNGVAVLGYMSAAFVGEFLITRRNVFVIWCLGGAAALVGLLWLSQGRGQDLVWYGVMSALFFGSQAVFIVMVSELFPREIRATAIAVCGSAPCYLGLAIFPLLTTALVGRLGWTTGLSLAIVPPLVGAGLIALFLPNHRSGLVLEADGLPDAAPSGEAA